MSKRIGVTVPDSETLSSEKSKRFTVSRIFTLVFCELFFRASLYLLCELCHSLLLYVCFIVIGLSD